MLSPYKLYKEDMKTQRKPVTWGPKGKPYMNSSGTLCYTHKNIDWTVHRLGPALAERGKPGGKRRKAIGKVTRFAGGKYEGERRPKITLQRTSPRWGDGNAPSLHGRNYVPFPKRGTVEVSKNTKVAVGVVGAAAVGVAGYEAYKHRKEIHSWADKHTPHFHMGHQTAASSPA